MPPHNGRQVLNEDNQKDGSERHRHLPIQAELTKRGPPRASATLHSWKSVIPRYLLLDRGAGFAGDPVVEGVSSEIQVIALRSYLNPFALFRASFVAFITRYHLLLSLVVT